MKGAPRRARLLGACLVATTLLAPLARAQDLVVFAASSLTEAFQQEAAAFDEANPGTHVLLNFAGSSTLSTQITQGAPAAVFASADLAQMKVVVEAGLADGKPADFAGNALVVVAASGAPVRSPADLADKGLRVVLAGPVVPVGAYSRQALHNLDSVYGPGFEKRVLANVVSEELNVREVAAKVELGEADAAIVYSTDAAVLHGVKVIPIPPKQNVAAVYQIAVMKSAAHLRLARAFMAFVLSPRGQAILGKHGFTPPPG